MDGTEEQLAKSFLRRCSAAYESLVARVLRLEARGDGEKTLKWLSIAAGVAWSIHPGRFADERLEAIALRIGERLEALSPIRAAQTNSSAHAQNPQRRVLHVATTVYEAGGHTRLLENWIKSDGTSLHSLMLLDQQQHPVRAELAVAVAASGGALIVVPAHCPFLEKARRLRQVAQSGYDHIVLHHHPNDVVPAVALATTDCPPVAVMNHADHVFWLGVSVADAIIDFRGFGARLSRERRGGRKGLMLPLPLDLASPALGHEEARARLGISPAEVMLLSIGFPQKYTPTKTHDFFRALNRVLTDNPAARLYIVGIGAEDFRSLGVPRHERIELLGIISDPSVYEAAADLYLESFPINSYTALFETAARGVCPVLMYAPTPQVDLSGDPALEGLITSARDEADYVARVTALIDDPGRRAELGQAVARRIASTYGADGWRTYLDRIYEQLAAMAHRPAPLPAQARGEMEEDLNLAKFHSTHLKKAVLQQVPQNTLHSLTIGDVLRLAVLSLRIGDTRLTPSHFRTWLGLLRHRAFPRRPAFGA